MATKEMVTEKDWTGPGWYASRQVGEYDNQRIKVWYVAGTTDLGPSDYDEASTNARMNGQGTPFWAEQESDLEKV